MAFTVGKADPLTTADPIRTVAEVGTFPGKSTKTSTSDWHVTVKDGGQGARIDVRRKVIARPGSPARTFQGWTRDGLWLEPTRTVQVAEMMAEAVVRSGDADAVALLAEMIDRLAGMIADA